MEEQTARLGSGFEIANEDEPQGDRRLHKLGVVREECVATGDDGGGELQAVSEFKLSCAAKMAGYFGDCRVDVRDTDPVRREITMEEKLTEHVRLSGKTLRKRHGRSDEVDARRRTMSHRQTGDRVEG